MAIFSFGTQTFTPSLNFSFSDDWSNINFFNFNASSEISTGCTTLPAPTPPVQNYIFRETPNYDHAWEFPNQLQCPAILNLYDPIILCPSTIYYYGELPPTLAPICEFEATTLSINMTFNANNLPLKMGELSGQLQDPIFIGSGEAHDNPSTNHQFIFGEWTAPNQFIFTANGINYFNFAHAPSLTTGCNYVPPPPPAPLEDWLFTTDENFNHVWEFSHPIICPVQLESYSPLSVCPATLDEYLTVPPELSPKCSIDTVIGELSPYCLGNIQNDPQGVLNGQLGELYSGSSGNANDPQGGHVSSVLEGLSPQIQGWNSTYGITTGYLNDVGFTAQGFNANLGEINQVIGEVHLAATGFIQKVEGTINASTDDLSMTCQGFNNPQGHLWATLDGLSLVAEGNGGVRADVNAITNELVASIGGSNPVIANLNVNLEGLTPSIIGNHFENQGVFIATLDDFAVTQMRGVNAEPRDSGAFKDHICSTLEDTKTIEARYCNPHTNTQALNKAPVCSLTDETDKLDVIVCNPHKPTVNVYARPVCSSIEETRLLIAYYCNPHKNTVPINSPAKCATVNETIELAAVVCNPHNNTINLYSKPFCDPKEETIAVTAKWCNVKEILIDLRKKFCDPKEETEPLPSGQAVWVDPEIEPPDPDPPTTGTTYEIPEREVYKVNTTASLELPNGTPIGIASANLNLDADGHSWSFNGSLLNRDDRDLIKPDDDGLPVIVWLTINDYVWHVLVEKITTNRTFNSNNISFTGRGVTCLMSYPYTPLISMTYGSIQSNQQIAESLLPNGWVLNWNLPVWNIPPNTYSFSQKSPIQALLDIVKMCGGMLVPKRDGLEFTARPRYPVLPWDFTSVNPDVIVPDDVILSLSEEATAKYGTNGVHVHGEGNNGRQALVRRTGTAGDKLSAVTSNPFMVDSTAIRAVGERAIAADQPQPTVSSIDTWMTASTGDIPIFEMGQFARLNVDADDIRGIVSSQSVSLTLVNDVAEVMQSINISEDTGNVALMFDSLVLPNPLEVCTVTANIGKNCIVSLINGGSVQLFGNGTVGTKYYFQGRELKTTAPNFSQLPDIVV